jgi:integrase
LNVVSLILRSALRRGLITSNPIPLVDRPREGRRRWRILTPAEAGAVERALDELIEESENDRDRDDRQTVRAMFLTLIGCGIRRGEALGLRWRAVALADPDGPKLRVEETWVRHADDTPKSQLTSALKRAGIEGYVRPCHDLRHTSITNAAAAGTKPEALMSRSGHSSYSTTRSCIELAGESFRDEADLLEDRLWGGSGTKNGYHDAPSSPDEATGEIANAHR